MIQSKILSVITPFFPALLFAFPACAIATPIGAGLVQAALLIIAILGLGHYGSIWADIRKSRPELKLFLQLWLLSVGFELTILAIHGAKSSDIHSPLLRIAALGAMLLMIQARAIPTKFWYGVITGCIAVLCVAVYQRYALGLHLATGFHNRIHFGNFSLLLGLMSMVAMTQTGEPEKRMRLILGAATCCGLAASLLAGARGGWISLVLAGIPIYALSNNKKRVLLAGLGIVLLTIVAALIPSTGILERLRAIQSDLQSFALGNIHTSIGIRLELFRASWQVYTEHYLVGIGGSFLPVLEEMRRLGIVIPPDYELNDTHNEILFAMVRGGILGLAQVSLLYVAPLIYFASMVRKVQYRRNLPLMAFCGSGLVVVMATIEFGLSVNVFTRHIGKAFYFVMICFLIASAELALYHATKKETV